MSGDTVHLAGLIATVASIGYMGLGLPSQILEIHRRRSVEGLSLPMFVLSWCTWTSWVVYALLKQPHDWFIAVSNGTGTFFGTIILIQFASHRGRSPSAPEQPE